ncbi:ABC transporter ATP-binding protein [Nostoc sp. 'Peltigera membranacea cyanobiont' N6]|uniref:ABC transporter ATP-binding protein n=1 Tax=Nostoc sp. 'Peltigera membranacea cyanobiont' N6 TaxID=1261031 RepID=UPI000CF3240D|nr:ABC transporter ATP-binding protein [Nostoc sp. 'Peltigera membranacea cyanobiont' N6]AVH66753.1 ABC transporter ATP-binding protein [Nostoc sp. 'Peltigera membranacea cyanobiont' N6]
MSLIEIRNVSKTFRKGFNEYPIIQNMDFFVKKGEFVVLLGKNGAGKSTLLNLILGLVQPSEGEVKLMGLSPQQSSAKKAVGAVLQETTVPKNLKVKELVQLVRSYYPQSYTVQDILKRVGLEDKSEAWVSELAGGEKQRLYFALALVGNPELLILDEPTQKLDTEGYEMFWQEIRFCQKQGITILMVIHPDDRDFDKLSPLATRYVTLHALSEAPPEGQLSEDTSQEIIQIENQQISQNIPVIQPQGAAFIFLQQMWVEIIQLFRTPLFLLGIILFACFSSVLPFHGELAKQALTSFSVLILLTIAIDRLGKRVSVERAEGWLKLLRITPLPPVIYIAAKVVTTLLLSTIIITLIMILGIWRLKIDINPEQLLLLVFSLVLGVIPFAVFGLALSYLTEPKSYDSIAGLSIPLGLASCGALPLTNPRYLQDLVAFSPFYHYRELTLWAAGLDYDEHLLLHLLWLLWAGGIFGLIAVWAYKRDSVIQ